MGSAAALGWRSSSWRASWLFWCSISICGTLSGRRSISTRPLATAAGARIRSTRWSRANSSPGIIITSASTSRRWTLARDRVAVILFPAIDLKGGACVRLVRGEMASATVFNDDPAAQARQFAAIGFHWLHVVDLDGAFAGHSVNGEAVRAIRRAVDLKIQLGGGIRDRAAIDNWLWLGLDPAWPRTA